MASVRVLSTVRTQTLKPRNRALRRSSTALRLSISFSHDHIYITLFLQRSVSADIEARIDKSRIPDCLSERVLVLGTSRLISVTGPRPLTGFLYLTCGRAKRVYPDWTRRRHLDGVKHGALVLKHMFIKRSIIHNGRAAL